MVSMLKGSRPARFAGASGTLTDGGSGAIGEGANLDLTFVSGEVDTHTFVAGGSAAALVIPKGMAGMYRISVVLNVFSELAKLSATLDLKKGAASQHIAYKICTLVDGNQIYDQLVINATLSLVDDDSLTLNLSNSNGEGLGDLSLYYAYFSVEWLGVKP